MMPNKTYELRNLYFEQSRYSQATPEEASSRYEMIYLPRDWNFKSLRMDIGLLEDNFKSRPDLSYQSVAEQIFGSELKKQYVNLKHVANMLKERSDLHQRHLKEIDRRHIEAQEKLFGAQINRTPENAKRVTTLEGHLAMLDKERRDEETAFWKDTVDLRQQLIESGWNYRDARQRNQVFTDLEVNHDR